MVKGGVVVGGGATGGIVIGGGDYTYTQIW